MKYFELSADDISDLGDGELRELIGRLCEAELLQQELSASGVLWGGAQEAPDGGLDVSVSASSSLKKPDFVPRAYTGFQVKKHTMGKAACTNEMLDKGVVKPIIADLAAKKGAYVIVSGKDDCSDKMYSDRLDGMKAAITLLGNKDDLKVDFYGRDRIAAWLRKHPGVSLWARHKLGKPLSGWKPFGRWAATPSAISDEFLADDHPCIFPANSVNKAPIALLDGINLVRDRLRSNASPVRITGLSGVGKSRFVQALFEDTVGENPLPYASAIYADLGDDLSPTAFELVSFLIANDIAAYLVLDNCPPDVHRTLQSKVSSSGAKLRLLSIEYDISDDKPEETEVFHLEPASEATVSKLVQRRFPDLGRNNSDKIAEFAGGNARVALALASRVEADETLNNFSDQQLFQRLFSQRKGEDDDLLNSAEVLSLVYSFNTNENEFNDELSALARIANIDRGKLFRHQAELLRRQIAQRRGNWRAVLPHALANRLARRALENLAISQINAELFKPQNERIFKSCAHRIGYLHDSGAAKELAQSWIAAGAPLNDVSTCSSEQLVSLAYIAPVFPETVLAAFELAATKPNFATRENPNSKKIIRLLYQLAYEDNLFERVVELMLKFAETEAAGENNNSIVSQMKNLFSLHLSGTEASPLRRQSFVAKLFQSSNSRHIEIAEELMASALMASHWSSSGSFEFGARWRGYGWQPSTRAEKLEWYNGFVSILRNELLSKNSDQASKAKKLVSSHFRGLWSFAGCFDALEDIVREHAKGGIWPDIWFAIKKTIHFDGKAHTPELLKRLETLEGLTAPSDPYSEMEAYVLTNTWDHIEANGRSERKKNIDSLSAKIFKLGELACTDPTYLERLGERLWVERANAIPIFGKGLARGSRDKAETFEYIVGFIENLPLEHVNPSLIDGFIQEVYVESPHLARKMQERVLEVKKLKEHFVFLLCATPIETWGTKLLIELAQMGELDASKFAQISYGRSHETINDDDLATLIKYILQMPHGVSAAFQILEMRLFIPTESDYRPTEPILSAGRSAIKSLASMHRDDIAGAHSHGLDRICDWSLGATAPINEVSEIAELVFDGIENYRLYSFELGEIISPLVKNFPELILNLTFCGGDSEKFRSYLIFRDRSIGLNESSLNFAPIDRILSWCGGDQEKIIKVANVICPYETLEDGSTPLENPRKVKISDHMLAILEAALDKVQVIDIIFERVSPNSWSGSRADIIEVRAQAISALANHPRVDVKARVVQKLKELDRYIQIQRKIEAEEHNRREQRFE